MGVMFNHPQFTEEQKCSLVSLLKRSLQTTQADRICHKLIHNGLDIEIGSALIEGLSKEITDTMMELIGFLKGMEEHFDKKERLIKDFLNGIQETPAYMISDEAVAQATDLCDEPDNDKVRKDMAASLGSVMVDLAVLCPTL
jgi:hypothetical protein